MDTPQLHCSIFDACYQIIGEVEDIIGLACLYTVVFAIYWEKSMNLRFWVVAAIIFILLTACQSFSSNSKPTAESAILEATQTPPEESAAVPVTITPLEPETPTAITSTSTQMPELFTSTPTQAATDTPDRLTRTPTLTLTPILVLKPSATQALLGAQIGSPIGIPNFTHPDLACQWMGLAGQVFDIDDIPIKDLVIEVGGTLGGQPIFGLAITGQSEAYGLGGYEIILGDEPIASDGTIWAQVFDLDGNAISSPTYFSTYAGCDQNLILLNFVQTYMIPSAWFYLPVIYSDASP